MYYATDSSHQHKSSLQYTLMKNSVQSRPASNIRSAVGTGCLNLAQGWTCGSRSIASSQDLYWHKNSWNPASNTCNLNTLGTGSPFSYRHIINQQIQCRTYCIHKKIYNYTWSFIMPNTNCRRWRDKTVLSRRRRRCEHNSQLAQYDCRRIRSTIWKLTKQTLRLHSGLTTWILIDIDNFFNNDDIMTSLLKKLSISIKISVIKRKKKSF